MKRSTTWLLGAGLLAVVAVWMVVWSGWGSENLSIAYCDVGQGDAAVVSYQGNQMVVDGGPGSKVMDCLDKYMPIGDKTIEVVVVTNPDKDHFAGILSVLESYTVNYFVSIPIGKDTDIHRELIKDLEKEQADEGLVVENLYSGEKLRWGEVVIEAVWPDRQWVAGQLSADQGALDKNVLGLSTTHRNVNDFSEVLHLRYGEFDALFNGDAGEKVQDEELATGWVPRQVEVMTSPHHGSRTGVLDEWLEVVSPQLVVISCGKNNRYGHPAPEILRRYEEKGIKYLRTDQVGDVVVESDGEKWWVR